MINTTADLLDLIEEHAMVMNLPSDNSSLPVTYQNSDARSNNSSLPATYQNPNTRSDPAVGTKKEQTALPIGDVGSAIIAAGAPIIANGASTGKPRSVKRGMRRRFKWKTTDFMKKRIQKRLKKEKSGHFDKYVGEDTGMNDGIIVCIIIFALCALCVIGWFMYKVWIKLRRYAGAEGY